MEMSRVGCLFHFDMLINLPDAGVEFGVCKYVWYVLVLEVLLFNLTVFLCD